MHTWWIRLNAVVFFSLTLLLSASLLSAITSQFVNSASPQNAIVHTLGLSKSGDPMIQKKRAKQGLPPLEQPGLLSLKKMGGLSRAHLVLELDVDLSSLFHWNVWQVFAYVTACYETEVHSKNCVVVWDRIVPSKSQKLLSWLDPSSLMAADDESQSSNQKKSPSKRVDPRTTENQSPDPYLLKIPATLNTGYPIVDPSSSLLGRTILLEFNYDIMPITGGLYGGKAESTGGFRMYDEYTR